MLNLRGLEEEEDMLHRFGWYRTTGEPAGGACLGELHACPGSGAGRERPSAESAWDAPPEGTRLEGVGRLTWNLPTGLTGCSLGGSSSVSTKLRKLVIDADARMRGGTAGGGGGEELCPISGEASAHVANPQLRSRGFMFWAANVIRGRPARQCTHATHELQNQRTCPRVSAACKSRICTRRGRQ